MGALKAAVGACNQPYVAFVRVDGRSSSDGPPCSSDQSFSQGSVGMVARSDLCHGRGHVIGGKVQTASGRKLRGRIMKVKDAGRQADYGGSIFAVLDVPKGSGRSSEEDGRRMSLLPDFVSSMTSSSSSPTLPLSLDGNGGYASMEQRIFNEVVKEAAAKHVQALAAGGLPEPKIPKAELALLNDAYLRCGEVCGEYAKTFYLGTQLMTEDRRRAIWAIYVWCRRTDELVDGPNASKITSEALDRWEQRLEDVFRGEPYDMLDAALAHSVKCYPIDMKPFRDMIDGMRMDMIKSRYANFDELFLYCYNVAGTVGIMSVPVMGICPKSQASAVSTYWAALALGIANQLTNILRDVGEDAGRGRVYLPQDELSRFGLSDEDIFEGKVTDKWRAFMKFQIQRARDYFTEAEKGVSELDEHSRWPVWASLMLYRQILDAIEANDYNNFTKRAYVTKAKKALCLPFAYVKARAAPLARVASSSEPVFLS